MPVIPSHGNLLSNEKELHRFLTNCQENLIAKEQSQIISLAQEIEPIDPLGVLKNLAQANDLNFYWENPRKNQAIAAIGSTTSLAMESSERFVKAKEFIHDCLKEIIRVGNLDLPFAIPYLCCSFTFFPTSFDTYPPFPSVTIFLPQIQIINIKNRCVLVINIKVNKKSDITLLVNKIYHQVNKVKSSNNISKVKKTHNKIQLEFNESDSIIFESIIDSALKSIKTNQLSKIVIAHALDFVSPTPFKIIESLDNLRQLHPDCYIFSISNGKGANFIGASPERLISISDQQLVTDALAGSAPRGQNPAEDIRLANQLTRSEKEKREHEAVSQFIAQRLTELGFKPQQLSLQLLKLSNIQHLWTPIYTNLPKKIHPLDLISHLHPTPAVAGVPTEVAMEHIRRYENFDRSLYAAPLGWIDAKGNAEFIVGIRSALISENKARLYAGAGIVAGSQPHREFAEIQLKLRSLLKALV